MRWPWPVAETSLASPGSWTVSMRFVDRRGVRLAYDLRGRGPLVVLVQGLGLGGEMWMGLSGGLVKSGFAVVAPDGRGTGRSDAPMPPYRMATLAADLAGIIEDAGRGPAICVGISLGGMICQHLTLRYPHLVRGLVLAATTCGLPHGKLPSHRFLRAVLASFTGEPRAVRRVQRMLVHPRTLTRNPRIFEQWNRVICRSPTHLRGWFGQLCAAALHSTGSRLLQIRCPTAVVTGDADEVIPPENSRIIAERIEGATLTVLPEAGHAFPLEHPAALPELIRRLATSRTFHP